MFRLLLIALCSASALSGNEVPNLIGSWRSDAEATNAYLKKHSKLSDYQKEVLAAFFGRAVMTFRSDGTGTILMEATTIPKRDGGRVELEATESEFTFEVLASAESQIVIRRNLGQEVIDDYPFEILKFHDPDTYSVSLSDGITDINGREFFKRVKATNSDRDGTDQPIPDPDMKLESDLEPKQESEGRTP